MPCDGVAVATVKVALPEVEELLASPEALEAVASLLRQKGYVVAVTRSGLAIDGRPVAYRNGTVSSRLDRNALNDVADAFRQVGTVLCQERLADMVAQSVPVEARTWVQGSLVLRVSL
jgi:hypothetical protein